MLRLATCCTIAALASPAPGPHVGWEPLADDLRQPIEVDRRRIVRGHGVVEVWIRMRGDPGAVAREFEAAGADDDEVRRVRTSLHHSLHLWSFDCDDASHALAASAYYAVDASLIREFRPAQRAYRPVQPETVGERLLGLACGRGHGDTLADRDDGPDGVPGHGPHDAGDAAGRAGDPAPVRAR